MTSNDVPTSTPTDTPIGAGTDVAGTDSPAELQVLLGAPGTAGFSEEQANQIAGALGRNWGLLIGFGIVLSGLGIAMLAWPEATIGVLAALLGVALLISGIFSVIGGLTRSDHPTSIRILGGVSGVLSILLGVFALSGITTAVTILALMVGFGWIVRGIGDLAAGIGSKGQRGRGITIAAGILGIIAGAVVLVWPSITLVVLAYVGGIWLILMGLLQMVLAFRLRKVNTAQDLQQALGA